MSEILGQVLAARKEADFEAFSGQDVLAALARASSGEGLDLHHLAALLSPAAEGFLDELAQAAAGVKQKFFGSNISLFTPLYLSNYCASKCVYCGFQRGNKISRLKLKEEEITAELAAIAATGLEEILFLTGEGREYADLAYIAGACELARGAFRALGVEIYVMSQEEYAALHGAGCEFVTIFQETYSREKYARIHVSGEKRDFAYRFEGPARALRAGMRGVGLGALLGIDDFRRDALATALHAQLLQREFPHAEISLSVPRLRPIINNRKISPREVSEARLLQVLFAYRLFLPFANIIISSRERPGLRDLAVRLGASKMSAGVSTGVGKHASLADTGDEQFEISDTRGVGEIRSALVGAGLVPVMSEHIYVG